MVNAISLGHQFHSLLPAGEVPERTEDYEGFYHLMKFEGNVEKQHYIISFVIMIENHSNYVRKIIRNS